MKPSLLYRRAAEYVHGGRALFGCTAIYMLKHKAPMSLKFFQTNEPESLAFSYLFQNNTYRNTLYRGCFGSPRIKRHQNLRVLALCLMAAIAESDEKEHK